MKATPGPWPAPEYENDTGASDEGFWEWWEIPGIGRFGKQGDAQIAHCAPEMASVIRELLDMHKAHHNEPLHARARALLAKTTA